MYAGRATCQEKTPVQTKGTMRYIYTQLRGGGKKGVAQLQQMANQGTLVEQWRRRFKERDRYVYLNNHLEVFFSHATPQYEKSTLSEILQLSTRKIDRIELNEYIIWTDADLDIVKVLLDYLFTKQIPQQNTNPGYHKDYEPLLLWLLHREHVFNLTLEADQEKGHSPEIVRYELVKCRDKVVKFKDQFGTMVGLSEQQLALYSPSKVQCEREHRSLIHIVMQIICCVMCQKEIKEARRRFEYLLGPQLELREVSNTRNITSTGFPKAVFIGKSISASDLVVGTSCMKFPKTNNWTSLANKTKWCRHLSMKTIPEFSTRLIPRKLPVLKNRELTQTFDSPEELEDAKDWAFQKFPDDGVMKYRGRPFYLNQEFPELPICSKDHIEHRLAIPDKKPSLKWYADKGCTEDDFMAQIQVPFFTTVLYIWDLGRCNDWA